MKKVLPAIFLGIVSASIMSCGGDVPVNPEKIQDPTEQTLNLFNEEKYLDETKSYKVDLSEYVRNINNADFVITTESTGVTTSEIVDNRFDINVSSPGEKEVVVGVKNKNNEAQFNLTFSLNATTISDYFVDNAGFETGDLSGWTIPEGHTYSISDNLEYFQDIYDPAPTINQDGKYYLDGFNQTGKAVVSEELASAEAWAGSIRSSDFTLAGSGYITFKLGGSNTSDLKVKLMKVQDGGDVEVAKFNNWAFSDPYKSFGLTTYAYKVDETHIGSQMYFVLEDNATSGFAAFTADSFHTYYPVGKEPIVDWKNIYGASYEKNEEYIKQLISEHIEPSAATLELPNGDFETGTMESWLAIGLDDAYSVADAKEYFSTIFLDNAPIYGQGGEYFLGGCVFDVNTLGINGTGKIISKSFKVGGTGWITFKLGGGNNENLSLDLYKYNENGEDELISSFTNHLFSDPYRSVAMSTYGYKIDAQYMGSTCYFVINDYAMDPTPFAALSVDDIKTNYDEELTLCLDVPMAITNAADSKKITDDTNIYPAGFMKNPANSVNIAENIDVENANYAIRNGDFETGNSEGWFMSLIASKEHIVSNQTTFFKDFPWVPEPKPIYNKDGEYFFTSTINADFPQEGFVGSIYSKAFKVNDARYVSFKLGGTASGNIELRLLKYVDGVNDVEVAKFNNYLFSDPMRNYGMTRYAYQLPEEYVGSYCYFEVVDKASGGSSSIVIDGFKTDYSAAPALFEGTDDEARATNIADDLTFAAKYEII